MIALDFLITENLKKSQSFVSGEYTIWNDIYSGTIDADIAIYGASRAVMHFNPVVLGDSLHKSCKNMGINGLGFWHVYLRHLEYLKHNKHPKYIIFSIDIASLVRDKNLFNRDQFLPYMLFNEDMRKTLNSVNSFTLSDYYVPLGRYCGRRDAINCAIKHMLGIDHSAPFRRNGYAAVDTKWNDDFDNARKKLGTYNILIDSSTIILFDKFLADCSSDNIKIILVYSPEFIDGQNFVKNRNEIIELYARYSKKYNIPFLDYSDDEICYKKEYFYNASHLNKTGSDLFMQKFIRDLRYSDQIYRDSLFIEK
jgi:hypothetical protein